MKIELYNFIKKLIEEIDSLQERIDYGSNVELSRLDRDKKRKEYLDKLESFKNEQ